MTENSRKTHPLITELQIRHRTVNLAQKIAEFYSDEDFLVVSILKGAFMFTADLLRRLHDLGLNPDLDFMRAFSYGSGTRSSGKVTIELDVSVDLKDRSILIVDDIVDSGSTLSYIKGHILSLGAREVRSCVLLDKQSRREVDFSPDWVGFEIPDLFVIGYGMDYDEHYRNLPYITTLE